MDLLTLFYVYGMALVVLAMPTLLIVLFALDRRSAPKAAPQDATESQEIAFRKAA